MPGIIKRIRPDNVHEVIEACRQAELVGLDTETTALHPKDGKLRLIQLSVPGICYILDCFRYDPLILLPLFDGTIRFVGHNLAFDLRFLWSVGLKLPHGKNIFCTMIGGELLDAGILPRKSHALAVMSPEHIGIEVPKDEQKSDWSRPELTEDQLRYAAKDADIMLPLGTSIRSKLEAAGLMRTMRLEMRCLPGMVWLTMSGIRVDRDGWNALADKNKLIVEGIEQELADITDSADLFGFSIINWRSPQQVLDVFNDRFKQQKRMMKQKIVGDCPNPACALYGQECRWHSRERTIKVPYQITETGEETLSELAADGDALAIALLRYRKSVKARDTYGRNWSEQFIHSDGRVYSEYRQVGAFTGRMSCSNPNCQQVPHSKDFRCLFIPEEGWDFIDCDYSQIELRICVEMSRDPHGMQAYCIDKTDLHRTTAELILGLNLADTSPENLIRIAEGRQVAKSLNFGLIFGAGSETMRRYAMSAFGVALSAEEAIRLRNLWRETYKGIVAWQKRVRDGVETVYTLGGRRRLNVDKFTEKLNTPVQGTGIDGLKAGIALCYERRNEINSLVRPVTYVHDEILMESPKAYSQDVAIWLKRNMEEGMSCFLKDVPVVAEPNIISNWGAK